MPRIQGDPLPCFPHDYRIIQSGLLCACLIFRQLETPGVHSIAEEVFQSPSLSEHSQSFTSG